MDNKVEFETIKPPSRTFPSFCNVIKDFVLLYPMAVTYIQCCGVNKTYPCAQHHKLKKKQKKICSQIFFFMLNYRQGCIWINLIKKDFKCFLNHYRIQNL